MLHALSYYKSGYSKRVSAFFIKKISGLFLGDTWIKIVTIIFDRSWIGNGYVER